MRLRNTAKYPTGAIVRLQHESTVLGSNPWQDPATREVAVYLPHDYRESGPPLASLWDLAAYTNSGPGHLNWRNHGENLAQRLDRLIGSGSMPSVVVVVPDCYTSLGGNQYVNSPSVGAYADYLTQELVPFVDRQFNVIPDRGGRGLFGKSSGGYGALYHAICFPESWGAAASLAGDVGFDWVYRPELPTACSVLAQYGGEPLDFIRAFWNKNRPDGRDYTTMMILAMAASYDADPENPENIRLPVDLKTCELKPERWKNWLSHDPLNLVESGRTALQSLKSLIIEVGIHDQYNIQFGSRQLVDRLNRLGVKHRYEEFEGSHSSIDWRLDHVLPRLAESLGRP
jgi:enterochelin esterase-like enzyme